MPHYNCEKQGSEIPDVSSKYNPPNKNPMYAFGCKAPCEEEEDCPISSGSKSFTVDDKPLEVYGVCGLERSYAIYKIDNSCETFWGVITENTRVTIETEGNYIIRYKWNSCCVEPSFDTAEKNCC